MDAYKRMNTTYLSKDSIKETALKYDAGKITTKQYGEATLSGYLLFMTPKDISSVNTKEIGERAFVWLKEMGLEKYHKELLESHKLHKVVAYCSPDVDPEKLQLFFGLLVFGTVVDDAINKLTRLNKNNPVKHIEDMTSLIENLNSIIENYSDINAMTAAASKLNSIFKAACLSLSFLCICSSKQMNRDDYKCFVREILYYIRSQKWIEEYRILPYKENEYLYVRIIDMLISQSLFTIFFAKDIRLSDDIRSHPVFQRYYKNVILHFIRVNDILSLPREIADSDCLNLVLFSCKEYSLQESIYKVEKAANELFVDLMKDKMLLMTYFPTNENLKNFIITVENSLNGVLRWYQETGKYGKHTKFETNVVEHCCDYNNWLEQIDMYVKNMKEPKLDSESDNVAIPSIYS